MNKVIVFETSRKATFGNAGELSVKLTDGDWADVEDLKVSMDVPRIVGTLTPHYSYAGSELVMGGNGYRFPLGEYNITISGNLGGVFELTIGVKILDNYDSGELELSLPASGGAAGGGMLPVTWAELKNLRDNGQLVAGMNYRITDYVATTTDPESASANHPFDIIVVADDVNVLSENARAVAHEGDEYFAKCNLAAWQLKYTIDNDMDRFPWAQEGGVHYLINVEGAGISLNADLESDNDTTQEGYPYRLSANIEGQSIIVYSPTLSGNANAIFDIGGNAENLPISISQLQFEQGKGVIFEMIDENNNRAGYDFKGIVFRRYKVITTSGKSEDLIGTYAGKDNEKLTLDESDSRWCYLFNVAFDDLNEDDSVGFYYGIPNNNNFKHNGTLLNGVFHISSQGGSPFGCTAGVGSYNWTCGDSCHSWTCGGGSRSWTCGNNCWGWTCGNNCVGWTCGNNCLVWTCGSSCSYWSCGNDCNSWSCGNGCNSWSCGNGCMDWTCGNNCWGWTCGSNCMDWTMANGGVADEISNISSTFPQIVGVEVPYYIGKNSQGTVVCKNLFD